MKTSAPSRCQWAADPVHHEYHDTEWGVPAHDDRVLFEFLILEGAQAGLSWTTILKKRDGYRKAFAFFDPREVARFTEIRLAKLMNNPDIVRNRLKIASAVSNARAFLKVQEEFGSFDAYIWGFVDGQPIVNGFKTLHDLSPKTPLSGEISKDLKRRGFRFVGSTIVYAYMQAVGMVNDHTVDCFRYGELR
ncbi:MAG: DNA-3-methyladenine glycosylase I [Candidatus Hydrogenedentes bacterium]|nr:DNA-3-methyladenine glycosylase I [Candidatus Hydrogenedentota bacterium]